MSDLPKFNFKTVDLTDEALDAKLAEDAPKSDGKFLKPGKYELQISKSEYKGLASDATWMKWVVTYDDAGGKSITDMLMVPTTGKLTFTTKKGEEDTFAVRKLKNFLEAIGAGFSTSKLGEVLPVYFGKENALVGTNVAAEVGYPGTHVKFLGKNDDGTKRYGLVYKSGDAHADTTEFADYDAVQKHCEEKKIELKRFTEVLKYAPSATANKQANSNW